MYIRNNFSKYNIVSIKYNIAKIFFVHLSNHDGFHTDYVRKFYEQKEWRKISVISSQFN